MEPIVLILLLLVVVIAIPVARRLLARVTVYEYQRGLRYRNGRFAGLLEPGRYWIYRPGTAIVPVDVREMTIALPGQELICADGFSVKVSVAARYRIADPVRAINGVQNFTSSLYAELQIALREVAGARPIEELLQQRNTLGADLVARAQEPARALGVELLALDVKDLMFPGATKRVFAQVVEARQQGLAALEKARGETAALRSLANAARLVEDRPALMQLRLVQQIGSSTGNTVILGMPQSSTPIPVRPTEKASATTELPPGQEEE